MTEYIPKFILDFEFNSLLGILLYWVPLVITAIDAIKQSYTDIRRDINERSRNYSRYTIGDIVFYIFQTVTPVVNLLKAVFVSAPNLLRDSFHRVFTILDTPVIPYKKD
jgi:phage-related protein